jgi:hypothetical protein
MRVVTHEFLVGRGFSHDINPSNGKRLQPLKLPPTNATENMHEHLSVTNFASRNISRPPPHLRPATNNMECGGAPPLFFGEARRAVILDAERIGCCLRPANIDCTARPPARHEPAPEARQKLAQRVSAANTAMKSRAL